MKRRLLLLCCLCGASAFAPTKTTAQVIGKAIKTFLAGFTSSSQPKPNPVSSQPPTPAVLRWNNGETASGEIIDATANALTWKTPLFEDPLLLDWHALHRIDHALPRSTPSGTFRFTLRDGSHLYGDLVGITADTVAVHSARCGDLTLQRSEVLSARRLKGPQLIFDGPQGESGWTDVPDEQSSGRTKSSAVLGNVPTHLTGPGRRAGAALLAPVGPPLTCRCRREWNVEFRVRAKDQPAFQIALVGDAKQSLRVETWGNELVLTAADFFQSIRKLEPSEHEAALRVCWDSADRAL